MIAYYDAENNTGNGHSDTTTTWKDLSGNDNDGTLENVAYTDTSGWLADKIVLSGDEGITFPVKLPQAGTFSLEIVLTEQNYEKTGIIVSDKGWSAFHAHTWNNNGDTYIGGNANTDSDSNRFTPDDISYVTTIGKKDYICYTYDRTNKGSNILCKWS